MFLRKLLMYLMEEHYCTEYTRKQGNPGRTLQLKSIAMCLANIETSLLYLMGTNQALLLSRGHRNDGQEVLWAPLCISTQIWSAQSRRISSYRTVPTSKGLSIFFAPCSSNMASQWYRPLVMQMSWLSKQPSLWQNIRTQWSLGMTPTSWFCCVSMLHALETNCASVQNQNRIPGLHHVVGI